MTIYNHYKTTHQWFGYFAWDIKIIREDMLNVCICGFMFTVFYGDDTFINRAFKAIIE